MHEILVPEIGPNLVELPPQRPNLCGANTILGYKWPALL